MHIEQQWSVQTRYYFNEKASNSIVLPSSPSFSHYLIGQVGNHLLPLTQTTKPAPTCQKECQWARLTVIKSDSVLNNLDQCDLHDKKQRK